MSDSTFVAAVRRLADETVVDARPRGRNPLFDHHFYAAQYPSIVRSGADLYRHYLNFGCFNGYDPNEYFCSAWYLARNEDARIFNGSPIDHYLEVGAIKGRDPSPAFSTMGYLLLYPDVKETGTNPLLHYLRHGRREGRMAPPVFLIPPLRRPDDDAAVREIDPNALTAALPMIRRLWNWMTILLEHDEGTSLDIDPGERNGDQPRDAATGNGEAEEAPARG